MKKQIIGVVFIAINCIASLTSCKKNENSVNSTTIALQTIKSDPVLTIFSTIESRSGDDALFTNGYTYVVPEDNSFISAGISLATAQTLSQGACDSIVRYCTIPSRISFTTNINTEVKVASSLSGANIFADSSSAYVYFNGIATELPGPVSAGSSLIYKLTNYLSLPSTSLSNIVSSDPNLTFFNEAMTRTNLSSYLNSGAFTMLMPTNSAFQNAGYADIASIDAADINVLTQLLLYHAIPNTFFQNDLAQQSSITTLDGEAITVDTSSGNLMLKGNSDPTEPAIVLSNGMLTGNVIAFKISQVLLP